MPPRSKVYTLPPELRAELDARLVNSGFGGYQGLSEWLAGEGFDIKKSALHVYGSDLKEDFERTMGEVSRTQQLAQAYAEANPDEQSALTNATVRIAQESLLRITIALRQMDEDPGAVAVLMPKVTRALADLGRLDISREKWAAEREQEIRRDAASRAEKVAKQGGLSADAVAELRRAILGITE